MDKCKLKKNGKNDSGSGSSDVVDGGVAVGGGGVQIGQKPAAVKKKHAKKGSSDGEYNRQFSFRYLLYNSSFFPQRFRQRSRRSIGTSTAELNEIEKGNVNTTEDKDSSGHSDNSAVNKYLNEDKVGRSEDCKLRECPLCLADLPIEFFPKLISCQHRSCIDCYQQYLRIEISESRVNVTCPECPESLHPNDIRMVLNDPVLFEKYEDFTLRRILAIDPDTRWCPAPDCGYAVIASGCASCPKLRCERPGCGSYFCYHCKAAWHPNQTCDSARAERSANTRSSAFNRDSQREDIKCCPICRVLIVKMDDGSCNHMTCAVCGAEFCWLCMNVVGDLHYLSPSGCTFWGKKPWSRKKKILWQLGILVGAPVGIALIAGIAVPAIIIGVPIWTGRKMYTRFLCAKRCRRNAAIATGVFTAILAAPILATLAVAIGVPILLFYVYGVVPVSLCRSSGCGVTASTSGVRFDFDEPEYGVNHNVSANKSNGSQGTSMEAEMVSHKEANPSIGEASLSLGSGTHLEHLGREQDRESSSTVALAGSILAHKLEILSDATTTHNTTLNGSETASDRSDMSMKALPGSLLNYKTDAISAHSYKLLGNEGGSTSAEQRSEANLSLSSLDEVTASLVQRIRSTKEVSESSDDGVKLDDVVTINSKVETVNELVTPKPSPSRNILRNLFYNIASSGPLNPSSKSNTARRIFHQGLDKNGTSSLSSVSTGGFSRKKIVSEKDSSSSSKK